MTSTGPKGWRKEPPTWFFFGFLALLAIGFYIFTPNKTEAIIVLIGYALIALCGYMVRRARRKRQ